MNNTKQKSGQLIIGAQLRKARETLQLTLNEVADELSIRQNDVNDWEKGFSKPNLKQLENLSNIYGREIDYFLRETPSPPKNVKFRTAPQQSLRNLSKESRIVIAKFDELCRMALEFEKLLGKKYEVKIPKMKASISPVDMARRLREEFNLKDKPIRNLKEVMEKQGIRVFELPVPDDRFSGFSNWHSEYGPCILINAKDHPGRKNFTLVHEYAHFLYDHGPSVCEIHLGKVLHLVKEEQIANQFAIELLLPKLGIEEDFQKHGLSVRPLEREIGQMSGRWCVSMQALGYRLESLQLVEKGFTDDLIASWETKPTRFRRSKIPTWERRLGNRFVGTALEAYKREYISISKLAHSLGIPIRKAVERAEQKYK